MGPEPHVCTSRTWETEAERLKVPGHSQLYREFERSLCFKKPCLKTKGNPKTHLLHGSMAVGSSFHQATSTPIQHAEKVLVSLSCSKQQALLANTKVIQVKGAL